MERKTKARAETGAYLGIVAAILVIANAISYVTYARIDLTRTSASPSRRAPRAWSTTASPRSSTSPST